MSRVLNLAASLLMRLCGRTSQRWLLCVIASLASLHSYAACQYRVVNEWAGGFVAGITITNTGTSPINGWNLQWQYTGDNRLTNGWSGSYTGSNPYQVANLGWNAQIQPGQSIELGFQGSKGSGSAEVPVLQGSVCDAPVSSAASSSSSSSSVFSSTSSSAVSSSSSSVAYATAWDLEATLSHINFVSTKNLHNMEVHTFNTISGHIDDQGVARVFIDLNSINSGIPLRDQRMRDYLFETANYPTATISVTVPEGLLATLAVGQIVQTNVSAAVDLHGVSIQVASRVAVQRLSETRIRVQSLAPVLTRAADFNLTAGIEVLRGLVNLTSISSGVPVDFALVFDAR